MDGDTVTGRGAGSPRRVSLTMYRQAVDEWEFTPGDWSVGVSDGWLHFCKDEQTRDAPEFDGGVSILREMIPERGIETLVGAEVYRCPCGAVLVTIDSVDDPITEPE